MFNLQHPPKLVTRRIINAELRIGFNNSGNINIGELIEYLERVYGYYGTQEV